MKRITLFAIALASLVLAGCSDTSYDPNAVAKEKKMNEDYNKAHPVPLPPGQGATK